MIRFNYRQNLLLTPNESFDLDKLRDYLMDVAQTLCSEHKIGTYWRPGQVVEDIYFQEGGTTFQRREITFSGKFVNTYDWDHIFFIAKNQGLIQKFINENTSHRSGSAEANAL